MEPDPDPGYRYYSYHPAWGPAEDLASMDNDSGDEYSIVFLADGASTSAALITSRRCLPGAMAGTCGRA